MKQPHITHKTALYRHFKRAANTFAELKCVKRAHIAHKEPYLNPKRELLTLLLSSDSSIASSSSKYSSTYCRYVSLLIVTTHCQLLQVFINVLQVLIVTYRYLLLLRIVSSSKCLSTCCRYVSLLIVTFRVRVAAVTYRYYLSLLIAARASSTRSSTPSSSPSSSSSSS